MGKKTFRRELRLVEERGSLVFGEDYEGTVRVFDKTDIRMMLMNRKDQQVIVVYEVGQLIVARDYVHPSTDLLPPRSKKKCLVCGHEFSAPSAIRVCPPCKQTPLWRSGQGYSVLS